MLVGEERFGLQEMQLTLAKYNCLKKVQFLDAKGIGALDNVAKLDYLIGSDTFIEEYVKAKESSKDRTSELASNSWLVVLPEGRPDFLITRMGYGWKDFYIVTENRERDSGIALQKI